MADDTVSNFVRDIHSHYRRMIAVADGMECLAEAFFETGNEKAADSIGAFADRIRNAVDDLRRAYSADLTSSHAESQRQAFDILKLLVDRCAPEGRT